VRVGVMIGPERGDTARKVARMIDDVTSGPRPRAWTPRGCRRSHGLRRADRGGADGRGTSGSSWAPRSCRCRPSTRSPWPGRRCRAGGDRGRLALGVGPSHHWIVRDMLGLPYEKPAAFTRDYLDVLDAALRGPGPVDVENETFTVHNPLDLGPVAPLPVLIAALGPVMLALAGERADGTVLWMADERAVADHVVPRITKAAETRAARRRGSSRASRSACAGRPRSTRPASAPTGSSARPRSRPTTSACWSTATPGHRRPVRGRRRGGDRGPVPPVRRRRRHRPVGAAAADRRGPRRTGRLQAADPGHARRDRRGPAMSGISGAIANDRDRWPASASSRSARCWPARTPR
jgi:hypothetical protein